MLGCWELNSHDVPWSIGFSPYQSFENGHMFSKIDLLKIFSERDLSTLGMKITRTLIFLISFPLHSEHSGRTSAGGGWKAVIEGNEGII